MSAEQALLSIVRFHHQFSASVEVALDVWTNVVQLALRHRVPHCLLSAKALNLSEGTLDSVRTVVYQQAQRQLLMRAKLEPLVQHLQEEKVNFLVFKGISLQEPFYRGCERTYGDVDLICHLEDLPRACMALESLGYRLKPNTAPSSHGAIFVEDSGVEIDLHTRFVEPYVCESPSLEGVFARRRPLPSLGCYTLDHIDHLMVLLLHGFKHHWCRLQWILDVALVLRTLEPSDLDVLEQRAGEIRAQSIVGVGLTLAATVFSLPILSHHRLYQNTGVVGSLCSVYQTRLFQEISDTMRVKAQNSILHLRALEGLVPRVRYVLGRAQNMLGISRLHALREHVPGLCSSPEKSR